MGIKRVFNFIICVIIALSLSVPLPVSAQTYTEKDAFAMGMDVAKYQGTIDWKEAYKAGVRFAFIKAGSSKGMDPYFEENMKGAKAAGIKTGVYLYSYATTVAEAYAEAVLMISWLDDYEIDFPVVYDVEDSSIKSMSITDVQAMIDTFCNLMSNAGYYPMVYSYRNLFRTNIGNIRQYKWVAEYGDSLTCELDNVAFWQQSSQIYINGIGQRVDIDYQFIDLSDKIVRDGFAERNGKMMCFSGYHRVTGWAEINGQRYFMDPNGYVQKGMFLDDNGSTYYLTEIDGHAATGTVNIAGKVYTFDAEGKLKKINAK
ncbi:MAG: hypothetical protein K6E33_08690 [Lachnospiraceae bacterium]|nr:hypothetical protein [Lachnospiraceae bacterium]